MKKEKSLRIRLTQDLYDLLEEKAEVLGITKSDYIRNCIVNKRVSKKCKDLPSLIHLLKIGNNINQIAKNLNIAKNNNELSEQDYDLLLDELMQINNNLKALLNDY
jgi:hypothetical protein